MSYQELQINSFNDESCKQDIRKILEDFSTIEDKENKKNKIVELFTYLSQNIWFVNNYENFRNMTIFKAREFKSNHSEYEDLVNICNKVLLQLEELENDPKLELYKQMENVICEDGNSIYENLLNSKIIVKIDNIFKSFDRNELTEEIFKNKKFPSGEEIKYTDTEIIKNILIIFFELINTGDDTYILIPYETKTFVKKYKI